MLMVSSGRAALRALWAGLSSVNSSALPLRHTGAGWLSTTTGRVGTSKPPQGPVGPAGPGNVMRPPPPSKLFETYEILQTPKDGTVLTRVDAVREDGFCVNNVELKGVDQGVPACSYIFRSIF